MATATTKAKALDRIKMRIRKGDTVQVITGKDKGKTGEVLRTLPNENRVIVEAPPRKTNAGRRIRTDRHRRGCSACFQRDALFHRQKGGQPR